jgi:DNA mismatch repair protein MSH6
VVESDSDEDEEDVGVVARRPSTAPGRVRRDKDGDDEWVEEGDDDGDDDDDDDFEEEEEEEAAAAAGGDDDDDDVLMVEAAEVAEAAEGDPSESFRYRPGAAGSTTPGTKRHCRTMSLASLQGTRIFDDDVTWPTWLTTARLDAARRPPTDPDFDPNTLHLPSSLKLTDMMSQYWAYKKNHMHTILFVQWGAFFEVFWHDAEVVHRELGLAYTVRKGMNLLSCGVPKSGWKASAEALVRRGYTVAMLAQDNNDELKRYSSTPVRDARPRSSPQVAGSSARRSSGGGAVAQQRNVRLRLSLGTMLVEDEWAPSDSSSWLLAVKDTGDGYGVCLVDAAGAQVLLGTVESEGALESLLTSYNVVELLHEAGRANVRSTTRALLKRTGVVAQLAHPLRSGDQFWSANATRSHIHVSGYFRRRPLSPPLQALLDNDDAVASAFGAVLFHLGSSGLDEALLSAATVRTLDDASDADGARCARIDGRTLGDLAIIPPPGGQSASASASSTVQSVFEWMDCTSTPFGKRLLRRWLMFPLRRDADIAARTAAVDTLLAMPDDVRAGLRLALRRLPDVERRLVNVAARRVTVRNFAELLRALAEMEELAKDLAAACGTDPASVPLPLRRLLPTGTVEGAAFPPLEAALSFLTEAFNLETARVKGVFVPTPGHDEEVDAATEAVTTARAEAKAYLASLRRDTSCSSLAFHPANLAVVTAPPSFRAPSSWTKTRSSKKEVQYSIAEVVSLSAAVDEADARRTNAMDSAFARLLPAFEGELDRWREAVAATATLDALLSLAERSAAPDATGQPLTRAQLVPSSSTPTPILTIVEGRHPLVAESRAYVPNSLSFDEGKTILLLTGPNMGGKSTTCRTALILVLLAQVGCRVPAASLRFTPADSFFTRVGARDHLSAGLSTFMVEMRETAEILRCATVASLVAIDELGRGTSTVDGTAVAAATLLALSALGARTFFATHYHSLTTSFASLPSLSLSHLGATVTDTDIHFSYQLLPGPAPSSAGAAVARLAGLPPGVLAVAKEITGKAEREGERGRGGEREGERVGEREREGGLSEVELEELRSILRLMAKEKEKE